MNKQVNTIQIERFLERKFLIRDTVITGSFLCLFLVIGFFEKNLMLPGDGLGLFQHKTIWIFLLMSVFVPLAIRQVLAEPNCVLEKNTVENIKTKFLTISQLPSTSVLFTTARTVGFLCFVGNTLQNAYIFNRLPFDFWDSINYPISYGVTRLYKFYLFACLIPIIIIYVYILLKAIAKLIILDDNEIKDYPALNDKHLNNLCNLGLNVMLILIIPVIISSIVVYMTHDRFDPTTVTTFIVAFTCTVGSMLMYMLMVKNYHISMSKYSQKNIRKIDFQLAKIHEYILFTHFHRHNSAKLDAYLKKEKYLYQIKERIELQRKYPLAAKAICTSIAPMVPALIKIAFNI
mgnify:CR=1 FL=1